MQSQSYNDKFRWPMDSNYIPKGTFKSSDTYRIGSYEIYLNKRIGIGAYSMVYIGKCTDEELCKLHNLDPEENRVAIKKISVRNVSDRVKRAINDEIDIMKKIKANPHKNIVTCYDTIDDIDTVYIIMEYCDCGDLSKIIGRPIKEESAKYYFKQLINGIKYLNTNHIIHRDIKPKNILLTNDKTILKICDFGLAKDTTGMTRISTICGSPLYMAPEMFNDRSYNETVDIWSVGIILYEMLCGQNPFYRVKDKHELEQLMMNNVDEIRLPSIILHTSKLSDSCLELLYSLLQKDAVNRITFEKLYRHEWIGLDKNDKNTDNFNVSVTSPQLNCLDESQLINSNESQLINSNNSNNSDPEMMFHLE